MLSYLIIFYSPTEDPYYKEWNHEFIPDKDDKILIGGHKFIVTSRIFNPTLNSLRIECIPSSLKSLSKIRESKQRLIDNGFKLNTTGKV